MKKLLLSVLLLFGCVTGRDVPEYSIEVWILIRIESGSRDNKPITVEVWKSKDVERFIYNTTGYKVGDSVNWPVQK